MILSSEWKGAEGKLYLFVGIHRTRKFAVTRVSAQARQANGGEFLASCRKPLGTAPTVSLTEDGMQFAGQSRRGNAASSREMRFGMIREENNVKHRLTKPNEPWINGRFERMNRTSR